MGKRRPLYQLDLADTGDCAAFALRKAARAVTQRYDCALRRVSLRSTQFTILVAIAKKQPISVGALADLTVIDQTTMTRSLGLLSAQGLIEITERSEQRHKLVTLTAPGRRQLARAVPLWRAAQKSLMSRVNAGEWTRLRRKLGQLVSHAHQIRARLG
jgi:DNA-binding MarR family transcriptional regulator